MVFSVSLTRMGYISIGHLPFDLNGMEWTMWYLVGDMMPVGDMDMIHRLSWIRHFFIIIVIYGMMRNCKCSHLETMCHVLMYIVSYNTEIFTRRRAYKNNPFECLYAHHLFQAEKIVHNEVNGGKEL